MGAWNARLGLAAALGVVGAVLVALLLGLDDPWWSAISAWVVAQADRHAVVTKSVQRVFGTLMGLVAGLVVAALATDQPALLLLGLFCIGALGSRARYTAHYPYAWLLGAVTAVMVLVQAAATPDGLFLFAANRTAEILTGVITAALVALLVMPAGQAPVAAAPPVLTPMELRAVTLIGGLVLVVVMLGWSAFDLPQPLQMAISAVVVLDRDPGALEHRGRQRILGCALGGVFGLAAMAFSGGSLWLWLGALGMGLFVFSVLHVGGGPSAYVGTQGGLAVIITLVSGQAPPDSLVPVVGRLTGATLGVLALMLVTALTLRALRARGAPVAAAG